MKKIFVTVTAMFFVIFSLPAIGSAAKVPPGEKSFVKNCAVCHANGENIINPPKTLHRKILEMNGIKKPADIVEKMRHPGPGMTTFDKETIPDKEAKAIAEYILKTFK